MSALQDNQIIALLFARAERALGAVQKKYGALCACTVRRILPDQRDVEECVSDVWLRLWNAIPPERPRHLGAYIARIARNLAIDRFQYNSAEKRNSRLTEAFEELANVLPSAGETGVEDQAAFSEFMALFLSGLRGENRVFFVRYYWYGETIGEISRGLGISEGKIKSSLFRTREKLRAAMEKEGIGL